MSRVARQKLESGYYHIMNRGNECRNIFMDDEDRKKIFYAVSPPCRGSIAFLAYCLMDNHTHLLIKENENGIVGAMRSTGTAYVVFLTINTTGATICIKTGTKVKLSETRTISLMYIVIFIRIL